MTPYAVPRLSLPAITNLPVEETVNRKASFLFFIGDKSTPALAIKSLCPIVPTIIIPFLLSGVTIMRVEKTDSTSRLSKFKAVCTTSSSELPQAIVTGSPDFKTKGFCPYTDKTAKKKARKEMSFLYFIVFIFNIAKIRRNGIRFHRIRYNNMEIRP